VSDFRREALFVGFWLFTFALAAAGVIYVIEVSG